MTAITFDTLKLAQRLRDEVKFPPEQAEKAASVLADTFTDWQGQQEVATKADINSLKNDVAGLESRVDVKLAELKNEIIKWVVGIGFAQVAMIIAALKLHS